MKAPLAKLESDLALPIIVLGAGITGLTVAERLRQLGHPVIVVEAGERAGGAIRSVQLGAWLHEAGPNTLFEKPGPVSDLIDGLGLGNRRREPPKAASRRYLVHEGSLHALPGSPLQMAFSELFSLRGKLAIAAEPFRSAAVEDESVASFVSRRLGGEFLDRIVDPFVAGIFAGDATRLSVRSAFPKLYALERDHGSLIRGTLAKGMFRSSPKGRMVSFPQGLEELPRALSERLGGSLRLHTRALSLSRSDGAWVVETESNGIRAALRARVVVSTLPAWALAALRVDGQRPLASLEAVPHPPVASVFTGYRREDISHPLDGFGLLAPTSEHRRLLGTLFTSTLFDRRAPSGHVALTSFVGGSRNPESALLPDEELADLVHGELSELLGAKANPVIVDIRRWAAAIPQYNLGHSAIESRCEAFEAACPGLVLGGNFLGGPSLSACIESGLHLADRALSLAD